jgi:hypothetical protein
MKNKIYLFIIGITLSSCLVNPLGIAQGGIDIGLNYQPNNFKYIKSVIGSDSESYFLGIGGFNRAGLRNTALNELKKQANLKSNQMLINVAYDHDFSYFFIFVMIQERVVVSADVIEFYPNNSSDNNIISGTLGLPLKNRNHYKIEEERERIFKNTKFSTNDKVEVKTSFKTYTGIFVRHGSDRFEINTTKGKRKIFIYKEIISLKKVD